MKPALALLPLLAIAAVDDDAAQTSAPAEVSSVEIAPTDPEVRLSMPNRGLIQDERCDDYIHQVRRDLGLSELRREPAQPGGWAMWSAVDRRIDGCAVLVRHDDPNDVRPYPKAQDGPLFRRVPASGE